MKIMTTNENTSLDDLKDLYNREITNLLDKKQSILHQAMHYSIDSKGKRLRPLITLTVGLTYQADIQKLLPAAIAIELMHTFSLIHDDLPCMDDDDLRRGKPTTHKKFNEPTAVLAGDALQTLAFETLANSQLNDKIKIKLISCLAKSSGAEGMALGQTLDMQAEINNTNKDQIFNIHQHKTGALIGASFAFGHIIANCQHTEAQKLNQLGKTIGLAFQIQDDILELQNSTETLGKDASSDLKSNKATFPSVLGMQESLNILKNLQSTSDNIIESLSSDTTLLRRLITCIINRKQ